MANQLSELDEVRVDHIQALATLLLQTLDRAQQPAIALVALELACATVFVKWDIPPEMFMTKVSELLAQMKKEPSHG